MRIKLNVIEPESYGYILNRIIRPNDVRICYIVSYNRPNDFPDNIFGFWNTSFKFKINK